MSDASGDSRHDDTHPANQGPVSRTVGDTTATAPGDGRAAPRTPADRGEVAASANEVRRDGHTNTRPGRDAVPHGGRRRRGRRGDEPEFTSYYGRPILQEPVWEARSIASYLFLGGLAGASSVLAAGAQATGRERLATSTKTAALGAIGLSVVALVEDLGRPERFAMMLRVVKPTSPMSVGSWILSAYGPAAGVAALTQLTGRFHRIGALATGVAAITGPAVASYTAVLVADTAVPAWHEGYRQLPFVFTGSAAAAAGGMGMVTAPVAEAGPARRAGVVGGVVELAANRLRMKRMGLAAQAHEEGRAQVLQRAAEVCTTAGVLGTALLARRSRAASVVSGLALLAGSACTRFAVFEAGRISTRDPKYVVRPQKERMARRAAAG